MNFPILGKVRQVIMVSERSARDVQLVKHQLWEEKSAVK